MWETLQFKSIDFKRLIITNIIRSFSRKYKEDAHQAAEYKEEIYSHFKMKEMLENTLPSKIMIGPFTILTEQLKTNLVLKRQELAQKLLDQFAIKMHHCVIEVNNLNVN